MNVAFYQWINAYIYIFEFISSFIFYFGSFGPP